MESISKVFWDNAIIGLAKLDKDGKFYAANPAFCNLLGYSEAELQEKTWKDVTHPEDVDGTQPMFEKAIAGIISSYTIEKRYITKRGNIIWASLLACVIHDENKQFKLMLKQVISAPIVLSSSKDIEAPITGNKAFVKDNVKLLISAGVGVAMTLTGVLTGHNELYQLGTALVLGLFGGFMAKK